MTATASRLGSAPISLDWTNLGIQPGGRDLAQAVAAWCHLKTKFSRRNGRPREVGFFDAPVDPELSRASECAELATSLLKPDYLTDCLFLGIGGSALGPNCLLQSLGDRATTGMRFHFMQSVDPVEWCATLGRLRAESTLIVAAMKSGVTFETCAQLLAALEWTGKARWKSHLVAITDPVQGDLGVFARFHGVPILPIDPSIGGRTSVFSPVGLFAAAMAGLNIEAFLTGARQIREHIEKCAPERSPLLLLAAELAAQSARRSVHVLFPYSSRLRSVGDWYVQLVGESLGKDGKGITPVAAQGPTDQHSLLQLLRDGPDDKITCFVTLERFPKEVPIPRSGYLETREPLPHFKRLEGHSFGSLMEIEYQATSLVLTRRGRPHWSMRLESLDERSMGALLYAWSVLVAMTGGILGVNPFDQPGVEEGKRYISQALEDLRPPPADADENSPYNRLRR